MRNNSVTFLGYKRDDRNQNIITLGYEIKGADGNHPSSADLVVPFKVASPVVGDNKYPVGNSYDPKTGILTYTFEILDNDDFNNYRQHQFNSVISVSGEALPFDTIIRLNGIEKTPIVIPTKTVMHNGKLVANLEVRRSNSKVPSVIEKVILSKHLGIDESKGVVAKYDPEFGGNLEITLTLDDFHNREPFNIEVGVKIPESNGIAYVSLSETNEIKTLLKQQVRKVFLANEILTVDLMVSKEDGSYPSEVNLPESFTRAVGVPSGVSKIIYYKYTKENGNLRLQVKVKPYLKRDAIYVFGCQAQVDTFKSNLEFYCKVDNTNGYRLNLLNTELTKYNHLKCRFEIEGGEYSEKFGIVPEIPRDVLNIKKAKSKQVTRVDNRTFDIIFLSENDKCTSFFVEGYLTINGVIVPYSINKTFKQDKLGYDCNSYIDKDKVIFNFKAQGNTLPIIDLENLRLYENGKLTDKTSIDVTSDDIGGFTVSFPRTKTTTHCIKYKLLGHVKIKLDCVRYREISNSYCDYLTDLGKCSLEVVKHDLSYDKEEIVLRPTFINGSSPVAVGLVWGETIFIKDKGKPHTVTYENGLLTIALNNKSDSNGRIYSNLHGWIKLPDYGQDEEIAFTSDAYFGSDVFPGIVNIGKIDKGVLVVNIVNKDGSYPEKVELETSTGDPTSNYLADEGILVIDFKYSLQVEEPTRYKSTVIIKATHADESQSTIISVEELIKPRPILSVVFDKVVFDDKELTGIFSYKCSYSDNTIPDKVFIANIYCVKTSSNLETIYNPKTGILTYKSKLNYLKGKLDIRHDVLFSDEFGSTFKVNSNLVYAPKTAASFISGELDRISKVLVLKWVVRDSVGDIPKTCEHSNKDWINNLGWGRGPINSSYDKSEGILTVIVPVKVKNELTNYTGENKFKLPFPDVNWYPLTFNITR